MHDTMIDMLDNQSKYNSTSGLATRKWGSQGWNFLFACIMGGYPIKIDKNNIDHIKTKNHFKNMFKSLGYTMPCIFCRQSYKQFYSQLPIEPHLVGRIELMYWLYLMRDKVNKKLIGQEKECFNNEKKKLKVKYHKDKISKEEYYYLLDKSRRETLITSPSPPFKEVLEKYEAWRATCSKKAKTCSLPKK